MYKYSIKFEYNKSKSEENLRKHGIDFSAAKQLWLDENAICIPAKNVAGEARYALIGAIRENVFFAVFTYRKSAIRIISVRVARDKEKGVYEKEKKDKH